MKLTSKPLSILIVFSIAGLALVAVVALRYSYSPVSTAEAGAGLISLLITGGCLWFYRRRRGSVVRSAVLLGMGLGLLWMAEITINNFIAPPLPARDIIDDIFWAIIAIAILIFAVVRAYRSGSFLLAVEGAIWGGWASGLLACCMGLCVIVFAMDFILRDPLNVAEWGARATTSQAPSMAAYFAFETFAGSFLHLVVLGAGMGGLLGVVGGGVGKGIKLMRKLIN